MHLIGEGEARIDIVSLKVMTQGGLSDRDVRWAVTIIQANHDLFLDAWRKYHG